MIRSSIRSAVWITASVIVSVSIAGCRSKEPRLSIFQPEESTHFTQGDTIHFGSELNSDVDPGAAVDSTRWVSNLDGEIGHGWRIDATSLRVGKHEVTATVRHKLGESSAHVTFFVDAPRQNK